MVRIVEIVDDDRYYYAKRKKDEIYIFVYEDHSREALLRQAARYATSPDLSWNWWDTYCLAEHVRQQNTEELRPG